MTARADREPRAWFAGDTGRLEAEAGAGRRDGVGLGCTSAGSGTDDGA